MNIIEFLRFCFGRNIKVTQDRVIIDGLEYTHKGLEFIIQNLKTRNADLESQHMRNMLKILDLQKTVETLRKEKEQGHWINDWKPIKRRRIPVNQ